MQLTEGRLYRFEFVSISEGVASAALELHQGYFTYYWRTRLDADEFMELIKRMQAEQTIATTSLTVIDREGFVKELPAEQFRMNLVYGPRDTKIDEQQAFGPLSLVRFEGPGQSWVWQYAPDDDGRVRKYSEAPYRPGLAAYVGCASSGDHNATFKAANVMLAASAIEGRNLAPHLDLFQRYLIQWEGRK
jgi:hypothetical protein